MILIKRSACNSMLDPLLMDKRTKFVNRESLYMACSNPQDSSVYGFTVISFLCFLLIEEDYCVYLKHSNKKFVILSLYVNNVLIIWYDMSLINAAHDWLSSNFDLKDMAKLIMFRESVLFATARRSFFVYLKMPMFRWFLSTFRCRVANYLTPLLRKAPNW